MDLLIPYHYIAPPRFPLPTVTSSLFSVSVSLFLVLLFNFHLILFLAALGLCCCVQAFSSCGEQGLLFVAVRGLLIVVASLVVEHGC